MRGIPPLSLAAKLLLAAGALLAGGAIYLFLRPSEPLFFDWARQLGLDGFLDWCRSAGKPDLRDLPGWLLYALPDGLWAFAYALLIATIWSGKRGWLSLIWLFTIPLLVLGFELGQFFQIVPGTFTLSDLLFISTGAALGFVIGYDRP